MFKHEFVRLLAKDTGLTVKAAKKFTNSFAHILALAAKDGVTLILQDIGTFEMRYMAPRKITSIEEKKILQYDGGYHMAFRQSTKLKKASAEYTEKQRLENTPCEHVYCANA